MNKSELYQDFIEIIKDNTSIAVGCTEPISIALVGAKITELLGHNVDSAEVFISKNILKNVRGVNIPNCDQIGADVIFALGLSIGDTSYNMSTLEKVTQKNIDEANVYLYAKKIKIELKHTDLDLYVEAVVRKGSDKAHVIIAGLHDYFVYIAKNDEVTLKKDAFCVSAKIHNYKELNVKKIIDFAKEIEFDKIKFILEAVRLNNEISKEGLSGNYRMQLGKTYQKKMDSGEMPKTLENKIISRTTAANDARMGGASLPVFTNSGSGNQGIAATMPVYVAWQELDNKDEDRLARALIISHLITIMIRSKMGRLTPTCGATLASIGSSAAVLYLQNTDYDTIAHTLINTIGNISGIVCDGAKGSCPMKIACGIQAGFMGMLQAKDNHNLDIHDGIVGIDLDATIDNLVRLNDSMRQIEGTMLDIISV